MNKILVITLMIACSSTALGETRTSVGDVYEIKSGELVYREHHTFSEPPAREFMRTEYKSTSGKLIAERTVNFNSGYASDYVFKQHDPELEIKVVRGKTNIEYTTLKNGGVKTVSFEVDDIDTAVVNAGMFNAIEREWTTLMAGEKVSIDLVVPDRQRAYAMTLKKVDANDSDMAEYMDTSGKAVFTLSIANALLKMLVAPVVLGYEVDSQKLVFYQGPSNLRRPNGEKYGDIRILYQN